MWFLFINISISLPAQRSVCACFFCCPCNFTTGIWLLSAKVGRQNKSWSQITMDGWCNGSFSLSLLFIAGESPTAVLGTFGQCSEVGQYSGNAAFSPTRSWLVDCIAVFVFSTRDTLTSSVHSLYQKKRTCSLSHNLWHKCFSTVEKKLCPDFSFGIWCLVKSSYTIGTR